MLDRHSHKKFWLAIVGLAIVAIVFFVAAAWMLSELNMTQNSLLLLEDGLEETQAQLSDVEAELAATQAELAAREIDLSALEDDLLKLQTNYDRLTEGYGYVLEDPRYREMQKFLAEDDTSEREYVESEYTCVDFAADVKANAAKAGIRCAYVIIEYVGGGGHAIVAFDPTDREGMVFIEPQFDWEVEPEIGKRYYQCVRPPPGYYMATPGYDDTITRIIIVW